MPRAAGHSDSLPWLPDAAWRQRLRRRLLEWFHREARDLPWRRTGDPYAIWLSEVMLQQTQVATVIDYYGRFLAAFPTIRALAEAPEERVLRQWEGLGYYRRARQLHRAAQAIVRDHGGTFPNDPQAVARLPGVGRYTAGAVLSIAFDRPEPILEANTIRLFARLLAYRGPTDSRSGQALLWSLAEALVPRRGAGRFNQALMELGALVCTPRRPNCDACPLKSLCPTQSAGLQEAIPLRRPRPAPELLAEAAVVVSRGRRLLLWRRGEAGRWARLWDFPRFPLPDGEQQHLPQRLAASVAELAGVRVDSVAPLTRLTHGVTRFKITLHAFRATYRSGRLAAGHGGELAWVLPEALVDYPLSTTARALSRLVT